MRSAASRSASSRWARRSTTTPACYARRVTSAIVSALHVLAVALGLASVTLRGRALKRPLDDGGLARLFAADNLWGVAALLLVATGLLRAFGGLEKGSAFYLS